MLFSGTSMPTCCCNNVLHNICIDHGLQWEQTNFTTEEDDGTIVIPHATTPSGNLVGQSWLKVTLIKYNLIVVILDI